MIEPTPHFASRGHDITGHPGIRVDPNDLARLQCLADSMSITVSEALSRLIEEGTRNLERKGVTKAYGLTLKQLSVLESLKAGVSVKEIAGQHGVSEGTIRTHIHRMRSRLNHSDLLSLRFHGDGLPSLDGSRS